MHTVRVDQIRRSSYHSFFLSLINKKMYFMRLNIDDNEPVGDWQEELQLAIFELEREET